MGCTGPIKPTKNKYDFLPDSVDGQKRISIESQKAKYFEIQEKLNIMLMNPKIGKFIKDSVIQNVSNIDEYIHNFYQKFSVEFNKENFTEENFKVGFMHKVLNNFIEDATDLKHIDFLNIVSNILENNEFKNPDIEKEDLPKNLILAVRRYFPQTQSYVTLKYSENLIIEKNNIEIMRYIFDNLKFNSKYRFECIKIILSKEFCKAESNLINTAELLINNEHLNGVCLYLNENCEDFITESSKYLFMAINQNESINSLVISSSEYSKTLLNDTIISSVYDLLSSKELFFLAITKLFLTEEYIKKLSSILNSKKRLRFLIVSMMRSAKKNWRSWIAIRRSYWSRLRGMRRSLRNCDQMPDWRDLKRFPPFIWNPFMKICFFYRGTNHH